MKKTKMWENVMRRIPKEVHKVVDVALKNDPNLICDLDKIVRTHSCRPERAWEFMEHVVALVASKLPGADCSYLRKVAFAAPAIDSGEKDLVCTTIAELKKVDGGFCITRSDGWSLYFDVAADGYEPQVGSEIWLYTTGPSYVMGIIVDGHVFKYETIAQRNARFAAERERRRAEERARFPEHDAKIANLPEIFQKRIKNFQRAPFFREDLEKYEIFVCEQAVLFAERLKTVKKLILWSKLSWEHQVQFIPQLEEAGYSGKAFGAACLLARAYLEKPDMITEICGALAPLVDSDAYLPLDERVGESA